MNQEENIYYNIDIINGRTTSQGIINDPRATFNETRDQPIIRDISKYKMAVMRFTMNGVQDIPLFIPHIEPNQTNPNKTVYSVKIAYLHTNLTLYESTQAVIWQPEDASKTPPNDPFTTQKMEYEYYYCNSYEHFVSLINNALSSAITDINAQVKIDDPTFTDLKKSFLNYEPSKKKFDFYILDDLKLKIYFNSNLYNLIGFYPHELDDSNNAQRYRIVPRNNAGLNSVTLNIGGDDTDYVKVEQEAISLGSYWSPVSSLVFTSSILPIIPEGVAQPITFGSSNTTTPTDSSSNYESIITDIALTLDDAYEYKQFISYIPQGPPRWISLSNNSETIRSININVFWKARLTGELIPIKLSNLGNVTMKLLFSKK